MLCVCVCVCSKIEFLSLITDVNSTALRRAAWNHYFIFNKNILNFVNMENVRKDRCDTEMQAHKQRHIRLVHSFLFIS